MPRVFLPTVALCLLLAWASPAQESVEAESVPAADITGTWITQAGNIVEVTLNGTEAVLYFPAFARRLTATFDGSVLVYITHYRDPQTEECYIDVPESEFAACRRLIRVGDERHRFVLKLSADGLVLSGTKEINVLTCEWDTDEEGRTSNHRPTGYVWRYFSDYQWRRSNCDFTGLPPLNGNALERYELIEIMLDRYGLRAEFGLEGFVPRDQVRFVYEQAYVDADTGEFVPASETARHQHLEPLDGRVVAVPDIPGYIVELYPYAFRSYVNLLSGLTILLHQYRALGTVQSDEPLTEATVQMQLDAVNYAWSHRQALCALDDDLFAHHIDFLSRAYEYYILRNR